MQITLGHHLAARAALVLLLIVGSAWAASGTNPAPRRIVSLNLCADQLVLALADPDSVLSVTWLARDPKVSMMAAKAAHVAINHGLAEEIVPLAPDLVVAGVYTTRTTVALLKRFRIPLIEIGVPQSLPAIYDQIRTVARALGHADRGEAMVAAMTAELEALDALPEATRPVAAVYQPNGLTAGRGSLIDDLFTRAGLRNLAAELTLNNYAQFPLEVLLLGHPDLLVLNTTDDVAPSLAHELLHHPSLVKAFPHRHTLVVPRRLWACPGPWIVDVITRLHDAAQRLAVTEDKR